MKETMVSSLTMVFSLTIPATIGLMLLAQPIIHIIFERGAFTSFDTIATANTLSLYAVGLFAYSSNKILVPVFMHWKIQNIQLLPHLLPLLQILLSLTLQSTAISISQLPFQPPVQ